MTRIALYCTDTMIDSTYAHLLVDLARAGGELVLVGDGLDTVRSLGGLPVTPEADLGAVTALGVDVLVVPGADSYVRGHERLMRTLREVRLRGISVAAIGAAPVLERAGLAGDASVITDDDPARFAARVLGAG